MIGILILGILLYGIVLGRDMYNPFLDGVKQGIQIVFELVPTMLALFLAVQVFRTSGALDMAVYALSPLARIIKLPEEVLPIIFAKLFSSSAATGFLLDIFKTKGPDSGVGNLASIMLSCTESCFYVVSIYFSTVKITKTRYTIPGALFATAAGIAASIFFQNI